MNEVGVMHWEKWKCIENMDGKKNFLKSDGDDLMVGKCAGKIDNYLRCIQFIQGLWNSAHDT